MVGQSIHQDDSKAEGADKLLSVFQSIAKEVGVNWESEGSFDLEVLGGVM